MKFTYASGEQPIQGYTIRRGLGRGGFGEVYLAVSDGGKEVALKLVQQHLDVELRGVGQCLNLKHTHLVSVYDILKAENDETWIVMEYMAGESLDQVLARHPQGLPEPLALVWLHGICAGVRYLHEHGIVHRDLKPGNLFIENGIVKIGDYGLSKFISASRRSGQTMSIGSVHYMAPEMSNGRYGNEVDQYALGVVLCEMLTGRVPFNGESQGEILMKHLTAEPDLGSLTEPYRSVVARLLDKDPRKRYPAVQDLLAELPALGPAMPAAVPDSEDACSPPGRQARGETAAYAAAPDLEQADNEPASEGSAEDTGVKPEGPAFQQPGPGGAKRARFAKGPLIRTLAENGMETTDIKRVLRVLRCTHPERGLTGKLAAVQDMVEHGMDARDIERVLRALDKYPKEEVPGLVTAVQLMIAHDLDAKDIERVLRTICSDSQWPYFGKGSKQELAGKLAALPHMVEHGMDTKDIERVLRALGECSERALAAKLETVQGMVDHDCDAKDIERILRALGERPGQELAGVAAMVQSMVENGVDANDIERVLRAVGEHPEQELPGVVTAGQGMVADGMEAEDIEKAVRVLGEYAE
jgi:hypothetical protein